VRFREGTAPHRKVDAHHSERVSRIAACRNRSTPRPLAALCPVFRRCNSVTVPACGYFFLSAPSPGSHSGGWVPGKGCPLPWRKVVGTANLVAPSSPCFRALAKRFHGR